eukprot:8340732-Pyramimonas_sp.AAC.1
MLEVGLWNWQCRRIGIECYGGCQSCTSHEFDARALARVRALIRTHTHNHKLQSARLYFRALTRPQNGVRSSARARTHKNTCGD